MQAYKSCERKRERERGGRLPPSPAYRDLAEIRNVKPTATEDHVGKVSEGKKVEKTLHGTCSDIFTVLPIHSFN